MIDLKDEIKNMPQHRIIELNNKKIYFGHQSVGFNIIEGLRKILNEIPTLKLNIVETKDYRNFDYPIFAHSGIGKNGDPLSKINDFIKIIESGVGDKVDMAFFKFCYIDITNKTDIDRVFNYYVKTIALLSKKYPNVKFVHFTVPLTVNESASGVKLFLKQLLKKEPSEENDNLARNKFNQRLLLEFGNNTVFNLAKWESTYPNGKINFNYNLTTQYLSLIRLYSTDGGHLNAKGKIFVAKRFINFLLNEYK